MWIEILPYKYVWIVFFQTKISSFEPSQHQTWRKTRQQGRPSAQCKWEENRTASPGREVSEDTKRRLPCLPSLSSSQSCLAEREKSSRWKTAWLWVTKVSARETRNNWGSGNKASDPSSQNHQIFHGEFNGQFIAWVLENEKWNNSDWRQKWFWDWGTCDPEKLELCWNV